MVDVIQLRAYYDTLDDEELQRIAETDLVPEARTVLEQELGSRGLTSKREVPPAGNPYAAPKTVIADPDSWATVKVSGLVLLFQIMAATSAVIGIVLYAWPWLPIPLGEALIAYRNEAGAGALAPQWSYFISMVMQPLWIISAFGLCFFKWWARPVFVATYALGAISNLVGGLVIWLSWEAVLVTAATLLDGAVLALAFLPPLSTYFERDRRE